MFPKINYILQAFYDLFALYDFLEKKKAIQNI